MPPSGYFSVGAAANAMTASPTWTRLDTSFPLQRISVDRGRSYEFDRTSTGTATVTFADTTGNLDPTNTSATYKPGGAASIDVMTPAVICLPNPADSGSWHSVFRGFVSAIIVEPHPTERILFVTYELVDALDLLAAAELINDGSFGTAGAGLELGDVVYARDISGAPVQERINEVLDDVGWPADLRQIFTGNVKLEKTNYPPRTAALSVIQDAADAEFPGVSNVFVNRFGEVAFHGRFARFDPTTTASGTDWDFNDWYAGDATYVAGNTSTRVLLSPPIRIERDKENLFTAAVAAPQGAGDYAGNYVKNTSAITKYGLRTWSADNLVVLGGLSSGTTAVQEAKLFADYYKDNYAAPRTRVGQLTVKTQPPTSAYGAATWGLLTGVDISDRVTVSTTHVGGGGISGTYYVEGVHYDVVPMRSDYPNVTCTLDVSPTSYYDANPFD